MNTKRSYIIYIIKNKINDKVYIGQTCYSAEERFNQHMKPSVRKKRGTYKIYNAIEKYGKENFYYEVIEEDIPNECINDREMYYINLYDSYDNGYNSTHGGDSKLICKISDLDILKKMFYDNITYSEIANFFNVNIITIQRTLHSIGLRRNNIITEEYLLENKDLKTNKKIAEEFNVSEATVTRVFQKYGIKRGKGCMNILNSQNKSNKEI